MLLPRGGFTSRFRSNSKPAPQLFQEYPVYVIPVHVIPFFVCSILQALTFIDEASRSRGHTDIAHGSETALGDEDLGVALEQALTAVACLRTLASAAAEALCSGGLT